MVTPRKPGAKRGRPPKPKSKKVVVRPVGRPTIENISRDHDRHAVALADALVVIGDAAGWKVTWITHKDNATRQRIEGFSASAACFLAAVLRIGDEWQPPAQGGMTFWEKRRAPGVAMSFIGYATTLRDKRDKYRDSISGFWREQMVRAFMLVLTVPDDPAVKASVLALAKSVGEGAFAERVLFAMIDARATSSLSQIQAAATFGLPELKR